MIGKIKPFLFFKDLFQIDEVASERLRRITEIKIKKKNKNERD